MPAFPLPGRRRQVHTATHTIHIQLKLLQKPFYSPRTHHHPLSHRRKSCLNSPANLSHANAHFTLALV